MRDVFVMWRNTRMVVLVALSAAIYAAILIPFKIIPIVPGFTELRPGNAVPIVCGLLFGPAAAWGCAIGNLIADFFGTIGPGSFFGMIGNFLFAYVPYRIWVMFKGFRPPSGSWKEVPLLVLAIFMGSGACAIVIGSGVELLGLVPYVILTSIITINNTVVGIVLGIPLLILMYPRARRWNLTFSQVMQEDDIRGTRLTPIAGLLVLVACIIGVFAALDMGGHIADWAMKLGILDMQPVIGDNGKPVPVSLLVPAEMSLLQLGLWCSLAILVGSSLMAKVGLGRRPAAGQVEQTTGGQAGTGGLVVEDVEFAYPDGGEAALRGITFTQGAGQMRFLMGRTGAGKSTLCLCLNGVIPQMQSGAFSGSVQVGGLDTSQWSVDQLSRVVGLVFQDFETQLFCSDVELEVAFGLETRGVPRELMRERVDYWIDALGLRHLVGRDPSTLSGGEKQRLALAAVMAAEPPAVVLDEPTTDLDPAGRAEVMEAVGQLADDGRTVVVATNESAEAADADGLLVLQEGVLAYEGAPASLLQDIQASAALGLRPDPLAELAAAVGLAQVPQNVQQAVEMLRERSARLDEEAFSSAQASEQTQSVRAPAATLENVSYSYGRAPALHEVSLQVRRGEFVAILGPNGSGKTTMCKLVTGLLVPDSGTVAVNDQDVSEMRASELAAQIGYLYQNPDSQIFADTVFDEVAFGPRNLGRTTGRIRELVIEALAITELTGYEDTDPFSLTRGERQRVALAAVLACEPGIIVFDEPTTGLDVPQQEAMMQLLKRLQGQGRTVIVVTHHTKMALRYAERLVLLRQGRVLADGPTRRVVNDNEAFAAAGQCLAPLVAISQELFGVPLLSAEEFERYVHLG